MSTSLEATTSTQDDTTTLTLDLHKMDSSFLEPTIPNQTMTLKPTHLEQRTFIERKNYD